MIVLYDTPYFEPIFDNVSPDFTVYVAADALATPENATADAIAAAAIFLVIVFIFKYLVFSIMLSV